MQPGRRTRALCRVTAIASLNLLVLVPTLAHADALTIDGDGLTPVTQNNAPIQLGDLCRGVTANHTVTFAIRKGNAQPRFANSESITVTLDAADAGLSATIGANAITLPANWSSQPNNTMSDAIAGAAGRTSSTITLTTAGLSVGPFQGNLTYRAASAQRASTDRIAVHAKIVDCDDEPPTLLLPDETIVEATDAGGAIVTHEVTATDASDPEPVVACAPASGTRFPLGDTEVGCTATDDAGNTATGAFDVTVADTTPPTVSVPETLREAAAGPDGSRVFFDGVEATDIVDGTLTPACTPASGKVFAIGATTVSCAATDAAGNTGTAAFDIIVSDTDAPILSIPADLMVEATGPIGATVAFTTAATDAVDGTRPTVCSPGSGTRFPLGATTITCSASDSRGNRSDASFRIRVTDTTPPTLLVPAAIELADTTGTGATLTYAATATDLVSGTITPTCSIPSGATLQLGDTTVRCSARDTAGNSSDASFPVRVIDRAPPVIRFVSRTPDVAWSTEAVTFTWSCEDTGSGVTANTVTATVSTEGVAQPATGTCMDQAGNVAQDTRTASIDRTAPTLDPSMPAQRILGAAIDARCTDLVSGVATCDAEGQIDAVGAQRIDIRAADVAGNAATLPYRFDVVYASGSCGGAMSREVLAPISADGSSAFKRGSSVPVRFRACDAGGSPVTDAGVVEGLELVSARASRATRGADVRHNRRAPDESFWPADDGTWTMWVATGPFKRGTRCTYRIDLNDGTAITFAFTVA